MWRAHARGDARLDYPPLEVWIEPTNHCNLRCVKCPHAVGLKRAKGFMDGDLYRGLIDQISSYAFTVSLQFGGESLIHKELPDLVAYAARRGLRTVLHTNATLLTEERSRALVRSGLSLISFSIDGEDPASYEAVDTGGRFDRAVEGVRTFLRARREIGGRRPFTVVQKLSAAPDPAAASASALLDLGADFLKVAGFHGWAGAFSREGRDLVPGGGRPHSRPAAGYAPCTNIWYGISVFWDGRVAPCCMDMEGEYPVGDIRRDPLEEIWNNERMVRLRRALVQRRHEDEDLCRDCAHLWSGGRGSAWGDARGRMKQELRVRAPHLARLLGLRRWGVQRWNA
jgi:radical SAM protein with 4Fe4S-binding SPASM domain